MASGAQITGTETVVRNLEAAGGIFDEASHRLIVDAAKIYADELKDNLSLRDHSLKELADLGYPYAASHPRRLHDPEWLVHRQTGDLVRSIRRKTNKDRNGTVAFVYLDTAIAPHAQWIVQGTKKMIPRPVVWRTLGNVIPLIGFDGVDKMTAALKVKLSGLNK